MPKKQPQPVAKKNMSAPGNDFWNNRKILAAIVAAVAFLIYVNTLNHQYALDDVAVIYQNKFVQKGIAGIPQILTTFYWQGYWDQNAGLYRPLSLVMFAVEWEFFPNQPFIGHLINVVLYAAACYLLFLLLVRLFPKFPPVFSCCIALLFTVHPVHTEVVANIKSRDEILSLFFFPLSVWQLMNYVQHGKTISWIYTGLFFFLALMSKEGALLFLFVYPLVLYFFTATSWKKTGRFMVPLIIISAIWFGIHQLVISRSPVSQKAYTYMDNSLVAADGLLQQTATAFSMMARYFKLLIYPYPLSYDYSYPQIPVVGWGNPLAIAGLLLCLGFFGIALKGWNKRSPLAFGIFFFFITIALTSNIFFLIGATMADRFLFVPSLGFCIAAVYLIYRYWGAKQKQQVMAYALVPVLLIFGYRTYARNQAWVNDYTLFTHDVNAAPGSARVHYNAATALLGPAMNEVDEAKKMALLDAVIRELEMAAQLDSNYVQVYNNMGVAYYHRKLYDQSIHASRKVLQLNPSDVSVLNNLADAYFTGNYFDSAIVYLQKSIDAGTANSNTYNKLGNSFFSLKKYDHAIDVFQQGIQKDSTFAELWQNLGNCYGVTAQYPQAIHAFEKAYQLNAANPQPLFFIAMTYSNMGDTTRAGEYLRRYNATQGK